MGKALAAHERKQGIPSQFRRHWQVFSDRQENLSIICNNDLGMQTPLLQMFLPLLSSSTSLYAEPDAI